MRAGELLDHRVVDRDGAVLGVVHDVRLAQAHPGGPFLVQGLIVGPGAVGTRLGYGHAGVRGPWLLRVLADRRPQWFVPWSQVRRVGDEVHVDARRDELAPPAPLPVPPQAARS